MSKKDTGNTRLPIVGILLAFVCVTAYFGWYRKPIRPVTSPGQAATASAREPGLSPAAATSLTPSEALAPNVGANRQVTLKASLPEASGSSAAELEPFAAKTARPWTISGRVVQTRDYCGGFAPPEELLESLRKEKPYPNKELFVRAGTINKYSQPILQRFVSDAEGDFKISLPPGAYCVVESSKKEGLKILAATPGTQQEAASQTAVEDCLRNW